MYKILKSVHMERRYVKRLLRCGFCGGNNNASQEMKELSDESKSITKEEGETFLDDSDVRKDSFHNLYMRFRKYHDICTTEDLYDDETQLSR